MGTSRKTGHFTAYRKDVVNVYHSDDEHRLRLDQSENARIYEAPFKAKTL